MRRIQWIISFTGILAIAVAVQAADPTTKPSPTTRAAGGRLFAPYSKLTSLDDEQRTKIREIHRKALSDKREIEAKETEEITALLKDDQKKELHDIEEKDAAAKKQSPKKEEMPAEGDK